MHAGGVDGSADLELEAGGADEERGADEQRGRDDPEGEQLDEPEHAAGQEQGAGPEADEPALPGQHAAAHRALPAGTGTARSTSVRASPAEMPWSCASGVTRRRWASTGSASALRSSGTT